MEQAHSKIMASPPPKLSQKSQTNWLEETKQIWKLYVAILGFGGTLCAFLAGGLLLAAGPEYSGLLFTLGTLLGVVTFGWIINAIRCPHCQSKLLWVMVKTKSHMSWIVELAALESCPTCQTRLVGPLQRLKRIQ